MSENIDPTKLGSCCNCGREDETVRNVITLELKSPEPGEGCWGCLVCDLPSAGAVAVLCDECARESIVPKTVCLGFPSFNRRVPFSELKEPFKHDMAKHAEEDCGPVREEFEGEVGIQTWEVAGELADMIIDHIRSEIAKDIKRRERHARN